jgi:hypothetical protein
MFTGRSRKYFQVHELNFLYAAQGLGDIQQLIPGAQRAVRTRESDKQRLNLGTGLLEL